MNLPRHIAWRYIRRPTDRLVSAVGLVSILGLVIGVMALVISMALMTGYRSDLQRKLLGGNAEIFIYALEGNVTNLDGVLRDIESIPEVEEASPVLFEHALVSSTESGNGEQVMLKGVDPSRAARSPMLAKIVGATGSFEAASAPGIAIGRYLASRLNLSKGDAVTVTLPTTSGSGTFLPKAGSFVVSNIYDTGFFEFDARWSFVDLREARAVVSAPEGANLIEVKVRSGASIKDVIATIEKKTDHQYSVTDWRAMNQQLFSLLTIQQTVLFIVIGLIVFVSTFNIVSTLIMTVHEKRREIGILISMGADGRTIRKIFLWYGAIVGLAGTLTGLLGGILVCYLITRFELVSFGPEIAEVYFVSSIPFVTRWRDLSIIAAFAMSVSFLATIVPSLRAARVAPVEALRHE